MAAHIWPAQSASSRGDAALASWLYVPHGARPTERMQIYRDGYPIRIRESLAETYAAIAHLVGDHAFSELADRYAASVPLTSYNLNDAGAQLAQFLRQDRLSVERPYLADLAALEWRVAAAFHAMEHPPFDPRTLDWSADEWAGAVLYFQPSVTVLSSPWPLLDLWTAHETGRDARDIDLHGEPEHLIVRRAGLIVRCESVSPDELFALQLLLDGHSLGASMEQLDANGSDAAVVMTWFSRWTTAGMMVDAVRGTRRGSPLPPGEGTGVRG